MEFPEKLQGLRKQRGMTQEELAEKLYVSRTAISKWESGRGYPEIESLKAIAAFFSVTVDELLSGEEILSIAKEEQEKKEGSFRDLVIGLLDLSTLMLLFLPLFADRSAQTVFMSSLLLLEAISPYLRISYLAMIIIMAICGVLLLILPNERANLWAKNKYKISLILGSATVILLILGLHPYAAIFSFVLLGVKSLIILFRK